MSCSHTHTFRHVLGEFDDWPNKFEDMKCENEDCGHVQDVRFQSCTVTEITP
ncbi:hypothetical protein MYX77_07750 [Acidobacteriia bacterium AH_259_A11_L15]|nr:hypothetical protein [Acidobacteriia bacterium AH_259_A11_L15]